MASSVIFATPVCPAYGYTGLSMRAASTLKLLSDQGYDVHLLVIPIYDPAQIPTPEIINLCKSWQIVCNPRPMSSSILAKQESHFEWQQNLSSLGLKSPREFVNYNAQWQEEINAAIEEVNLDLVIVFRFYIAHFVLSAIKSKVPVWLDIDELESNSRARLSNLYNLVGDEKQGFDLNMEAQAYKVLEKGYLPSFERIFASSNKEVQSLLSICPDAQARTLPNTYPILCPQPIREADGKIKLLFVGAFGYYPNRDAIDYFCANILPLIQNHSKRSIELDVIGTGLNPLDKPSNMTCVNFIGQVADITPYYANCDIVLVPLRAAGGTRIKILEAFSHKRAVVSTEIGAEGLEVIPGIHLDIADNPEVFAKLCIELIDNPGKRQTLATNGHKFFKENHTLQRIKSLFPDLLSLVSAARLQSKDMRTLLHESGLFDSNFYLSKNEDVAIARIDPLTHYLDYGAKEGRNPNILFSDSYYLGQCPELPNLGMSALAHYILEGWDKFNPHIMFDTDFYLRNYPEVKNCGMTPLAHYLKTGADRGYDPCREFNTSFYLAQDPYIRAYGFNPLTHYILYGRDEGRYTRNNFIENFPDSFIEDYKLLTKLEPLLPKVELFPDLPLSTPRKTSRVGTAYFRLIERLKKPFSQLFITPDLQSLGLEAYRTLENVIATYGLNEVLLLLTDSNISEHDKLLDPNLRIATLCDPVLIPEITNSEKAKILLRFIVQSSPRIVYNCGSEAACEVFNDFGKPLEHFIKLINF